MQSSGVPPYHRATRCLMATSRSVTSLSAEPDASHRHRNATQRVCRSMLEQPCSKMKKKLHNLSFSDFETKQNASPRPRSYCPTPRRPPPLCSTRRQHRDRRPSLDSRLRRSLSDSLSSAPYVLPGGWALVLSRRRSHKFVNPCINSGHGTRAQRFET